MQKINQNKGFNNQRSKLAVVIDFTGAFNTIGRAKLLINLHNVGWHKRFLSQELTISTWED